MADEAIHLTQWSRLGHSDPRVVLVHGSAQGSGVGGDRHYALQSKLAGRGWHVIAPDRPGHGRSPAPGRPDDPEIDGIWVANLVADGGHLVGHSFGGCVALAAAALRPEAVRSLTLIEPALQSLEAENPHIQAWGQAIGEIYASATSPADLAVRFSKLAAIPTGLLGRGAAEIGSEADAEEMDRLGRGLMAIKLPSPETIRENLGTVRRAGIPLLIVSGGWNPGIDATAATAAEVGGGRHVVIKSDHHFPHLVSGEFNDLLEEAMAAAEQSRKT